MRNSGTTFGYMLALCAGTAFAQTTAWSHDPAATIGPLHWGSVTASYETCGTAAPGASTIVAVGMSQTPVDIETANAVLAILPDIKFEYNTTAFEVENTGHVVEVVYDAGSSIRLGRSVTDVYQLVQFHFHAPSEHTVDGKQFDAELHLVHKNVLGQLVVVGVLLSKSASAPTSIFDQILITAPNQSGATGSRDGDTLNASSLLPVDPGYYSYAGSLTTPPCSEGVRWFVMQSPVEVSNYVIEQLHLINSQFAGYNGYANNNRPVVPLNGRVILTTF